jgi:hypothetical protein
MNVRGAVYIDGFNLYHAIDDLQQPYLKWVDLWSLGRRIIKGTADPLVKVVFCTAYRRGPEGKKSRHRAYLDALSLTGVVIEYGHEVHEPSSCPACGARWETPREKATDINLALRVYEDAHDDLFDVAFIVSADTDQAATFSYLKRRFPTKRFFTVAPPGRVLSQHLYNIANGKVVLKERDIHNAILPRDVTDGMTVVSRPPEYTPPWELSA